MYWLLFCVTGSKTNYIDINIIEKVHVVSTTRVCVNVCIGLWGVCI